MKHIRKQHQLMKYMSSPAGWFPDPWDLSGNAKQERWWSGLIWTERTREIEKVPDRNNSSVIDQKES